MSLTCTKYGPTPRDLARGLPSQDQLSSDLLTEPPTELPADLSTDLVQALDDLVAHRLDRDEFMGVFLAARVYSLCPVRPGLFVMSRPGGSAIVPVWSTVWALRQVMGSYDWCVHTGQDLVGQLPAGVGILIDAGMPHPITVAPSLLPGHPCLSQTH